MIRRICFIGYLIFMVFTIKSQAIAANTMTLTDVIGSGLTNYPLQFARPFAAGEIINYPKVFLDGVGLDTQADVKSRWSDGSVKHAIISVVIPEIGAGASKTLTFSNQTSGHSSVMSASDLLASNYDFNVSLRANFGSGDVSVSARDMLINGHYTTWVDGQIAKSIILCDHSVDRLYDIGADAYKSLRPIFYATFWPSLNKVFIRIVVENTSTEVLQDQIYSTAIDIGNTSKITDAYTHASFTHYAGSRWTKTFWSGVAPGELKIDNNLQYIVSTGIIPNYDTNKVIPESSIANLYAAWSSRSKDIYDSNCWTKAQTTTGGRAEIGIFPDWVVQYLYTGDNMSRKVAESLGELAGAWPMHFREGDPTKYIDREKTTAGLGKIMSISTRPSLALAVGYSYNYTTAADRITTVGTFSTGGWIPDPAHMPDAWSILYLLSGDHYFLEETWYWAAYGAAYSNGAATNLPYGRGPTGAEGGLAGQMRAMAWNLRTRVTAWNVSPDDSPEKNLMATWINDAIAIDEGFLNITNSPRHGSTLWNWGRTYKGQNTTVPPQHQYGNGDAAFAQAGYGIDEAVTEKAVSMFEQHFLQIAFGLAKQAGFDSGYILNYLGGYCIGVVSTNGTNPYMIGTGRAPTVKTDLSYFTDFVNLMSGYLDTKLAMSSFPLTDTVHGYDFIASASISFIASMSQDGNDTWEFMRDNVEYAAILNTNPKWALVPSATYSTTCNDSIQNGDETGVDCGGSCLNSCSTPGVGVRPWAISGRSIAPSGRPIAQ